MKIVALSDTHWTNSKLSKLEVPTGDILIHAGDATFNGKLKEWYGFNAWWAKQPHKHKVFVPGNHDFNSTPMPLHKTIKGITFGFMSEVPNLPQWAYHATELFMQGMLKEIGKVDVLVTHGPPEDILDAAGDNNWGSYALRNHVMGPNAPKVHIFGHVHDCGGQKTTAYGVRFYNVAICDAEYSMSHKVTEIVV